MPENIYDSEFVRRLFNRMSASYERMNFITSFGFSIRWRKQFIKKIPSDNNQIQVIDLLTGMGECWDGIRNNFPNAIITALDFSDKMLARAENRNRKKFNNKILISNQNLLSNNLPSLFYDVVVCSFGLKTFSKEQLYSIASETFRILKPGGYFSFVEVSKPKNKILLALYRFYLKFIIPVFGKLFLGNPEEYKMLWLYTEKFENALSVRDIFANAGLHAKYDSYFFGCATGLSGKK